MRTGSALLHRWSAALKEYDFTVRHRPGKSQTHVNGLSRLPVDPPPPEDTLLQVQLLEDEKEARKIARELHTATHLGSHALWKLFRDRYSHKSGRRICLETAKSCPQCQLDTDYGHRQKTTGTIQSQGPWDTLSIDIVGPLPPDRRHKFLIVFVDCFSKYTILIPSSNHTASTVSEALMRHVIPYFGTFRRLLSDRGREFISSTWTKLLPPRGQSNQREEPPHAEQHAPRLLAGRTLYQGLGRQSPRNNADPQRYASRASWILSLYGRYRSQTSPSPRPHLRHQTFSYLRRRSGVYRDHPATAPTHPPVDDSPTSCALSQPTPRRQLNLCAHHPSRADLQVGTKVERTISRLPHPQWVSSDIRRWWTGTDGPCQPCKSREIYCPGSTRTSAPCRSTTPSPGISSHWPRSEIP